MENNPNSLGYVKIDGGELDNILASETSETLKTDAIVPSQMQNKDAIESFVQELKDPVILSDNVDLNKEESLEKFITKTLELHPDWTWVFNWIKLCRKGKLSDRFMLDHPKAMVPDVYCKHNPVKLEVAERFDLIGNRFLQMNSTIDPRIIDKHADRMHLETIQEHQRFTEEQLYRFSNSLDMQMLVDFEDKMFKFQRPSERWMNDVLDKYIAIKDWNRLRKCTNDIFTHQKVSKEFVKKYYDLNKKIGVTFADINLIAKTQQLPDEIMEQNMGLIDIFTTYQNLSSTFIAKHQKSFKMQLLVANQVLSSDIAYKVITDYIMAKLSTQDTKYLYAIGFIKKQNYTLNLLEMICKQFAQNLADKLYTEAYIRKLNEHQNPNLSFECAQIEDRVNFDLVATCKTYNETTIQNIITNGSANRIPWYLFIKEHILSEDQIDILDNRKVLGHIEWWLILNQNRQIEVMKPGEEKPIKIDNKLSKEFVEIHKNKANWWKYVPADKLETFFTDCIKATEKLDEKLSNSPSLQYLRSFLFDFIKMADWKTILRFEVLPEWFIRIFGQDVCVNRIDKKELFWWKITTYQELPITFIRAYKHKLDLVQLVKCQKLDIGILEDLAPFFYTRSGRTRSGAPVTDDIWEMVAKYQQLTSGFILKYGRNLPHGTVATIPDTSVSTQTSDNDQLAKEFDSSSIPMVSTAVVTKNNTENSNNSDKNT